MAHGRTPRTPIPSLRGRLTFFVVLNLAAAAALAGAAHGTHSAREQSGWIVLVLALSGLCASVAVWAMRQAGFYRGALLAQATVVDPGTLRVSDRGAYYRDARITYTTLAGESIALTLNLDTEYETGETLSIAYRPNDPLRIVRTRAQPARQVASLSFSAAGFSVTAGLIFIAGLMLPRLIGR